ncbi:65-kDa microtubule-associated protein 3-like [Andrographis paniculata]|uniref:65-kDa microtubule-associated protein 3-like n=1 Tax=Andrographis paniculata TaxID=175694 RepID=UPI0021E738B8|nr:65-kDa microtubule-associated protein 3-like [Andrographis paniculata]
MPIRKSASQLETTCGSLLHELKIIWDEVGEPDTERDRMLLELEQECLEVYRRKVDEANRCRAQLRQAIAEAEAELAAICSAMGERPVHIRQSDQNPENLKAELRAILPQLEEMRKRRNDRKNQFIVVLKEMEGIKNEIFASNGIHSNDYAIDEGDLSIRKLEELQRELQALQSEKGERLKQVLQHLDCVYSLCMVLGLDFQKTINEIHPSLVEADSSKNISNGIIEGLGKTKQKLRELKLKRMQQLQDLATSLLELWNLMDTPIEEQQIFHKVTCKLVALEDEITEPNMLSLENINNVKDEVSRLEELKISKMKELVLKKKEELEVISRKTHLVPDTGDAMKIAIDAIESGGVDADCMLEQIEHQIARVKEEALGRKDILERVEKWMAACEEENWLEEYNRDDNRYNAGRGAHLMLKRAEKARALLNRLPAMVDALASKTIAWENEKGVDFTYDGVRLLSILEGYAALRKEKELEQKRQRDQKKLQGQLLTEQEAIYGSKPSPVKTNNTKKGSRPSSACNVASNRRLSLGVPALQTPKPDMPRSARATPNTQISKKRVERMNLEHKDDGFGAGRRCLDVTMELHAKQEPRKPFSPISSKANAANLLENTNKKHNEASWHKANTTPLTTTTTTPTKKIFPSAGEAIRTPPKTMIAAAIPSTPSSASIPMQMLPATPLIRTAVTPTKPGADEIEYSFEERRAGFVLPGSSSLLVVHQVM